MNRRSFIRTSAFGAAAYVSTTRFPFAEEFAGTLFREDARVHLAARGGV